MGRRGKTKYSNNWSFWAFVVHFEDSAYCTKCFNVQIANYGLCHSLLPSTSSDGYQRTTWDSGWLIPQYHLTSSHTQAHKNTKIQKQCTLFLKRKCRLSCSTHPQSSLSKQILCSDVSLSGYFCIRISFQNLLLLEDTLCCLCRKKAHLLLS